MDGGMGAIATAKQPYPRELYRVRQPVVAVCAEREAVRDALTSSLSIVEASAASQRDTNNGPDPQGVTRYLPGDLQFKLPRAKRERSVRPGTAGSVDDSGDEGGFGYAPSPSKQSLSVSDPVQRPPEGILKSKWMQKYQEVVPGVVVVALDFDVELSAAGWVEMETSLCSTIENVRRNLGGRSEVPIFVLLLQERDYPQKMEVPDKAELAQGRINGMCTSAKLSRSDVMLVYSADLGMPSPSSASQSSAFHPDVSVLNFLYKRVQNLADGFYRSRIKRLKAQRKLLDPGSPRGTALWIRYNFKIAQHYEARQGLAKAAAHYQAAYETSVQLCKGHLNGSLPLVYPAHELKAVAEVLHFRLTMLHTLNSEWVGALQQFSRHIDVFSRLQGPESLRFQHWEWMSRQYEVFAQLLEGFRLPQAQVQQLRSKNVLWAVKLDPAHYLEVAAAYATMRRAASQELGVHGGGGSRSGERKEALARLEEDSGLRLGEPRYVGGGPTLDTPTGEPLGAGSGPTASQDQQLRESAVQLYWLKEESSVDQSGIALVLLQQAHAAAAANRRAYLSSVKTLETGRKTGPLLVPRRETSARKECRALFSFATEHLYLGQWEEAVPLLRKAAGLVRHERWAGVLAPVLASLFEACEQLDAKTVVKVLALDALDEEQPGILDMLTFLVSGNGCGGEVDRDVGGRALAKLVAWRQALCGSEVGSDTTFLGEDTHDETPNDPMCYVQQRQVGELFRWKVESFSPSQVYVGEATTLNLSVQSTCLSDIQVTRVDVRFDDARYDTSVTSFAGESSVRFPSFETSPSEPWRSIQIPLSAKDAPVSSITTRTPGHQLSCCELRFFCAVQGGALEVRAPRTSMVAPRPTSGNLHQLAPSRQSVRPTLRVKPAPTDVQVRLVHEKTAMVGEMFRLKLEVEAQDADLHNVRVRWQAAPPPPSSSLPALYARADAGELIPLALDEALQPSEETPINDSFIPKRSTRHLELGCVFRSLPFPAASGVEQVRTISALVKFSHENNCESSVPVTGRVLCSLPFAADFRTFPLGPFHVSPTPTSGSVRPCAAGQAFHLAMELTCSTAIQASRRLRLVDIRLEPVPNVSLVGLTASAPDNVLPVNALLRPGEGYSLGCELRAEEGLEGGLGRAVVRWQHEGAEEEPVTTNIALPTVQPVSVPVEVESQVLPSRRCRLGERVQLRVALKNTSARIQKFKLELDRETREEFAVEGPQESELLLLPHQQRSEEWVVVPLTLGLLHFPRIKAKSDSVPHVLEIGGGNYLVE